MADVDIDPDSLRQAADEMDAVKEEVQALYDGFMSSLEQFADAFGGDEIGMLLGIAHQACSDALTECLGTNITELEDYAVCLREMADDHQASDDETAKIFEGLLADLES